jgi:hypothetical protein
LRYLGHGKWQYDWKVPPDDEGQCRTLTLTLDDGTTHTTTIAFGQARRPGQSNRTCAERSHTPGAGTPT